MRFSSWIGAAAAALLVWACFTEWVYIAALGKTISGLDASGTNFGKPGKLHVSLAILTGILFILPFVWAKRANIFLCAFNLAFAIRNYIIITMCSGGECPEKRAGIYLIMVASVLMLLMSFLPAGKKIGNQEPTQKPSKD